MVKKGILNELIKSHDLLSLEQHLIYSYLINNKIDFDKSPILTSYFKKFDRNEQLYLNTSSLNISSIKELENHLELIIPLGDRKLNGAFFTPDYIIDFIINEIKPKEIQIKVTKLNVTIISY